MIRLDNKTDQPCAVIDTTVTLDFDARQKSRQRLRLDDGREAGLMLTRGTTLADGDILSDAGGAVFVQVVAASEPLSYVHCTDRLLLNRVCYHLGNRHVPLQVTCEAVAYRHDHVLDDMVVGLGVTPQTCCCAFHPEPGAYEGHGHSHSHGHGHGHGHDQGPAHHHSREATAADAGDARASDTTAEAVALSVDEAPYHAHG